MRKGKQKGLPEWAEMVGLAQVKKNKTVLQSLTFLLSPFISILPLCQASFKVQCLQTLLPVQSP